MRRFILAGLGLALLAAGAATALGIPQRLASTPGTAAQPEFACTVKPTCTVGEVEVLRMSSTANAHVGTPGVSAYGNTVCCTEILGLGTDCTGTYDVVLRLSGTDNAHVAESDVAYTTEVCLSAGDDATVDCTHAATTCDVDYACLATISGSTNAHVADCDGVAPYGTKVCCTATPDNCPDVSNPGQENNVHPATPEGDHCEDFEPDGWVDIDDNCPDDFNPDQFDSEQPTDEWGDICDPDTQGSSAVSGEDGSITLSDESGAITFDGTTAEPYRTVTIEDDAAGVGTIIVTANANKGKVTKKFDIVSTSLLTGTVSVVIDFDPAVEEEKLNNMRVTKKVTGPSIEIPYSLDSSVCTGGWCTQATISLQLDADVTLTAIVPADTDSDGVYDQFDLNDDGDFDDADELDNCTTVSNPGQENADGDAWGDACDNCPATATVWEVPPSDGDCDGFANTVEEVVGTDPDDACPDALDDDAWPPDLNAGMGCGQHDGNVNILDVLCFKGKLAPNPYNSRYDFNGDGSVNILDVLRYKWYIRTSCTNP